MKELNNEWDFIGNLKHCYILDERLGKWQEHDHIDFLKWGRGTSKINNSTTRKDSFFLVYDNKNKKYMILRHYYNDNFYYIPDKVFNEKKSAEDEFNKLISIKETEKYKVNAMKLYKQFKETEEKRMKGIKEFEKAKKLLPPITDKLNNFFQEIDDCIDFYEDWLNKNEDNKEAGKARDRARRYISWLKQGEQFCREEY